MNSVLMSVLDGLVILTLLFAIYYMRIVAKAMSVIRQGKSEMQQVLKEMTGAIAKAEDTIQGMKRLADDKGRGLQKQIDAASTMTDELTFINQASEQLAKRLEKNTAGMAPVKDLPSRDLARENAPAKPSAPVAMSKAEKDLAAALAKRKSEAR